MFQRALATILFMLTCVTAADAADFSVVGAWKLVAFERRDAVSGETSYPWGQKPLGYLMYLPDGYMSAVLTSEGRKTVPANDDKQVAQLFNNMAAYAGKYTVSGDTVVHHVEVAWLPTWVDSDQPRQLTFDGDALRIQTQPIRSRLDDKDYIYILIWKRAR